MRASLSDLLHEQLERGVHRGPSQGGAVNLAPVTEMLRRHQLLLRVPDSARRRQDMPDRFFTGRHESKQLHHWHCYHWRHCTHDCGGLQTYDLPGPAPVRLLEKSSSIGRLSGTEYANACNHGFGFVSEAVIVSDRSPSELQAKGELSQCLHSTRTDLQSLVSKPSVRQLHSHARFS
ncbi:hypothetical protein OH77DRAFT_57742 [Trametes cingulata]|nr:hypothetical protein OH77DRAFT_57742 [Trametes cingulata]